MCNVHVQSLTNSKTFYGRLDKYIVLQLSKQCFRYLCLKNNWEEAGVSRHHRGPNEEHPPETPRTSLQYCTEGFKGLNSPSIMPRGESYSNSWYKCSKFYIHLFALTFKMVCGAHSGGPSVTNPLMQSGSFNICCPRDAVSRTANEKLVTIVANRH